MEDKKTYSGQLSLRLTPELHERLADEADKENRSINNLVAYLLEKALDDQLIARPSSSFEQRQFVGRTINGMSITPENGLVLVDGIYYRYLIDGNHPVDVEKAYVIIEANGNILTLRAL